MRIDDSASVQSDPRSVQLDRTHETQQEGARGRGRSGQPQGDSVNVSSLGSQVARALNEPNAEEVTRVEQAQRAEQTGGLDVSDEQLADALINGAVRDTSLDAEIARLTQAAR
jgi:anti-sigma28 factor (negative regulator of flagellin synthesis)